MYCGDARGDAEHAFPKWLQRFNNPGNGVVEVELPGGRRVPSRGWNFGRVSQVCTGCNQWMARTFESDAAPILKELVAGQRRVVRPDEQTLLASWAYKTALMLECVKVERSRVSSHELERFRETGEPPSTCSMVLASALTGSLAYHRAIEADDPNQVWPLPRRIYGFLLVVRGVVFHTIGELRPDAEISPHSLLSGWGTSLRSVWPEQTVPLPWPIEPVLRPTDVESLGNLFGGDFSLLGES